MKKFFSVLAALVFLTLFTTAARANPCSVDTASDLASSSSSNPLREVAAQNVDSACSIDGDLAESFPDSTFANSYIYFLTPELCAFEGADCDGKEFRKITLSVKTGSTVQPINFNVKANTTLIVGNYTDEMLSDTGDLYTTVGKIGTEAGLYHDETGDGKIDDTGFVLIDGSALPEGQSPFTCTNSNSSIYIRNVTIVTNDVTRESLLSGCIKNGGAVRVCNGTIKSGFEDGEFDSDTADWCNGTLELTETTEPTEEDCNDSEKVTVYLDQDNDGYGRKTLTSGSGMVIAGYIIPDFSGSFSPGSFSMEGATVVAFKLNVCPDKLNEDGTYTRTTENSSYTYVQDNTDCKDSNSAINPAATETCDFADNNCDGNVDEGVTTTYYADTDGDGYGDPANSIESCTTDPSYTSDQSDCDDTNAAINPAATETCDTIDNDCDDVTDEDSVCVTNPPVDADGDGYNTDSDCNDADATIYPNAPELCDGIDNDCDNLIEGSFLSSNNQTLGGTLDADSDGLSNYAELQLSVYGPPSLATDPLIADTDSDGIQDADEILAIDSSWTLGTEICLDASDENTCVTAEPVGCTTSAENCTDGIDNNDNGLVDCADAACNGIDATCPSTTIDDPIPYTEASSGCGCNMTAGVLPNFSSLMIMMMAGLGIVGVRRIKQ